MHTSSILKAEDFEFWGYSDEGPVQMEFPRLCPGYAETDRVAIVSPWFEDGVVNVPLAILSMATAFYDVQRARGTEFFDYPRHFALVGATNGRICVRGEEEGPDSAQVGPPWSNLDVWPETQWKLVEPTATAMLHKAYDLHINHLFWPEGLVPAAGEAPLNQTVHRLLNSRLKRVHFYSSGNPTIEVRAGGKVCELVEKSLDTLPGAAAGAARRQPAVEKHREIGVAEFLAMMDCFEIPR